MDETVQPEMPDQRNVLMSERFDAFKEALEVLYILANQSGRIQFAQSWPETAQYVFGEQLLAFDREGTKDMEQRAEFEAKAEDRRILLLEKLDGIEEKSVLDGALQIEYVQAMIHDLGRDIALHVYSPAIVERFMPSTPPAGAE